MENALNITQTNDATFFKFNFKPQVDEISFRFLMGSEEYDGNTECQFADGFAFLLREVGTQNYTNLAVLPDGTPVNVTNINNSNQCRKNAQYFEGYNPTTTNFGGHTKILIAKSAVTPGKTYEIKLVVADHLDSIWDSAIFLEAGSFDLGGDLGPDQTIANGNPGCDGSTITLDAKLTTTNMTFKWYKNNVLISGATNSTLDVTADGTYKFIATTVGDHGEHSIHVRDRYGCAVKTIRIVNIDYPKYFTPNGDGYHDTWNISSLKSQANAKIYIFDRYGKLLKELSPASDGWNGTFNGQPIPTSDYWFLVEYESPTTKNTEQFRAHFTLKR